MSQIFLPLLFAGDINVYSVARAFHEQYGIKSIVYGKYRTGPCIDSRILDYNANPNLEEQDTFIKVLEEFAEKNKDKTILANRLRRQLRTAAQPDQGPPSGECYRSVYRYQSDEQSDP